MDRFRIGKVQYIRCELGSFCLQIFIFLCFPEPIGNKLAWNIIPNSGCSFVVGIDIFFTPIGWYILI